MRSEAKTCAVSPQASSKGRIPLVSVVRAPNMSAGTQPSRFTASGENAGRQMAMYSASSLGVEYRNTLSSPRDDGFSRSHVHDALVGLHPDDPA